MLRDAARRTRTLAAAPPAAPLATTAAAMADDEPIPDAVELTSISIEPNNCALEEPLALNMEFTAHRALPAAKWLVSFMFDSASARKIVVLGETAPCDYAAGPGNTMSFAIDSISVASLKKHVVANIGMLTATLESAGAEVVAVNMVTQVTADASGAMVRAIFNPLE